MSSVLTSFGIAGTAVTLAAGAITVRDYFQSRQLRRTKLWPIRIRRAPLYSDVLVGLCAFLDEQQRIARFVPDIVVGVHYGGMVFATEAARHLYKPLARAIVTYKDHGNHNVICQSVVLEAKRAIKGRRVLVVDNSIRSGHTLKMSVDLVLSAGAAEVRSLVIFQGHSNDTLVWKPDYVLFQSSRHLKHWCR